jgi:HPt (histidine-containing phosphotransfer) domain-containing protein
MDGLEAARQIRNPHSAVRNHAVPVVAMTANVMQADRERCMDAGMNDFLSKPVSLDAMREVLEKWLPLGGGETAAKLAPVVEAPVVESEPTKAEAVADEEDAVVFDRESMMDRMMGDAILLARVTGAFLEDMPGQLELLKELLASGASEDAARQAHSIKGAAANVGGERLRRVAYAMEKAADQGDLEFVRGAMQELEARYIELKKKIEEA